MLEQALRKAHGVKRFELGNALANGGGVIHPHSGVPNSSARFQSRAGRRVGHLLSHRSCQRMIDKD